MWGQIVLGLLSAAASSAENDANNEAMMAQAQYQNETMKVQSQYQLALEQERTRQKREETKQAVLGSVINGVFGVLAAAAASNTDTSSNTNSNRNQ